MGVDNIWVSQKPIFLGGEFQEELCSKRKSGLDSVRPVFIGHREKNTKAFSNRIACVCWGTLNPRNRFDHHRGGVYPVSVYARADIISPLVSSSPPLLFLLTSPLIIERKNKITFRAQIRITSNARFKNGAQNE